METTKSNKAENDKPMRNKKGRFTEGHAPCPKSKVPSARDIRNLMTLKLMPYINDIDTLIMQIDDPSKRVDAIYKLMRFTTPTLSSIDYTEQAPRSLTAEQKLLELKNKNKNK